MNFKATIKNCCLTVKVKVSRGEIIDMRELDRTSRLGLRGLLKPQVIKGGTVLFSGPEATSLAGRLKKPIAKRDMLFLLEQIVVLVQKLHTNAMPLNNVVLNAQYIYLNEKTKEIWFLYIPTTTGQENTNLLAFIDFLMRSMIPQDGYAADFVGRFLRFFYQIKPFDIRRVEAFIGNEDPTVIQAIKRQHAGQSGFMTDKPQHYIRHYQQQQEQQSQQQAVHDPEATDILVEDSVILSQDEETALLGEDGTEETALLCEDVPMMHYPSLVRVFTGETISINKPVFRLGKEKSYVDYFVPNNIAVSRSHADIIVRGQSCFIKDLNSKNHTYINGQLIPVHCEIEIHHNDRLRLANEEFIFQE